MIRERPNISVVIPTYNREKTVGRAVSSVLSQTYPPAQVIVVDDGSVDDTPSVIANFGEQVDYIRQENAGVPVARNRGFQAATTDWVALLDSDDYWMPDYLERIATAIDETTGHAAFYFCDTLRTELENGMSQWERASFAIDGPFELAADPTDWVICRRSPIMLQSAVFHRERFFETGGLWEKLRMGDDTHLIIKLGLSGPACAVAGVGAQMTADDNSGIRLTTVFGSANKQYWKFSVLLWRDLLNGFPTLSRGHRRTLRGRLANAHFQIARFAFGERSATQFASNLLSCLFASPGFFGRTGLRGLRRLLDLLRNQRFFTGGNKS